MYNQKYHKFNSFYNHKFGFHITGPHQGAFNEIFQIKPKIVKTMDFSVDVMTRIKQEIPDVFLIGRLFVHPQDFGQLSGNTAQAARQKGIEMADRILREEINRSVHNINGRPVFDAWESLNEVFPEWTDENQQKLFDEYQVAFGQKMQANGFEPIAFNLGQGNGRGQQWLKLYPGTLETYKYLGFHEYDWPTMDRLHKIGLNGPSEPQNLVPVVGEGRGNDGMWRCLRYRRVMNEGIRQRYGDKHTVIITECGMTQGVWGGPSKDIGPWATQLTVPANILGGTVPTPISADNYWQTLQWYNSEIMRDDYVMGACLFVTGASGRPEWATFEHLGPIMDRLRAFQRPVDITDLPKIVPNPTPSVITAAGVAPAPQPAAKPLPTEIPAEPAPTPAPTPATPTPTPAPTPAGHELPLSVLPAPPPPTPTLAQMAQPPLSQLPSPPSPPPLPALPPNPKWIYNLQTGAGMGLLVGDIDVPNVPITVTKPQGAVERITSGAKPEYGRGGFETYAQTPGKYILQFLGQQFELNLTGQFTKVIFDQVAGPDNVRVDFSLRDPRPTYAVGEKIFAKIEVTNITTETIRFGILGLLTNTGQFQTSWSSGNIGPSQTFKHEDGLAFAAPGDYTIQLSICFARKDACVSGKAESSWARFKPLLPVQVR